MKENTIVMIIPYFGKLPNWFNLFLISASKTKKIDFILFKDDATKFDFPSNFKIYDISFKEFQNLFYNKLGDIYLGYPYKICEYKPCYGYVLNEYINKYKFWGHCDIDLIFGDIDKYLDQIVLDDYDRIFTYGHLSIYKNIEKVNTAFKLKLDGNFPKIFNFSFVAKTTYICNFDEVGINVIMKKNGFNVYEKSYFANVNEHFKKFRIHSGIYDFPSILVYNADKVVELKKKENEIIQNELMYVHFQNRKKITVDINIKDSFIISDEGFIKYDFNLLESYFNDYGKKETEEEQKIYYTKFLNERRRRTFSKIKRELKHSHINVFSILLNLYHAKKWLSKNQIR